MNDDVRREPGSRRLRPLRVVALGAAFALLAAACGSGRNNTSNTTNTTAAGGGSTPPSVIDASQCDPSTLTQGVTGNTIKIGTSLPLSGTYSAFNGILQGESAYFSYVNSLGGVTVAGKKYQIKLVSKDDAYDAARTSSNVNELINSDKVFALFNTVGTKNNLGIRETVNSDCVPDLLIASGAVQWGNTKYPFMLGSELVPYPLEMQVFVDYLKKNKPNAKIALLYANDDFGQSYQQTLEALVKGTSLSIVKEQSYNSEGSDVKSQVTDLAATKADTFVLGGTLLACPNALNAAHDAGWKP
ncbi:MAG TPA: ABC transporter substrate-binding protein, partial [Acidimicrobiia bacterium]